MRHLFVLMVLSLSLASCGERKQDVSPERAASNADFQVWVSKLPDKLEAPEPTRKSRVRGVFQGCLMATSADSVVSCRCNVRAITKTYAEPELGIALDRAWVEIVRPWKLADAAEIAKVQARIGNAPIDPVKSKAVSDLQALCGAPEPLKDE